MSSVCSCGYSYDGPGDYSSDDNVKLHWRSTLCVASKNRLTAFLYDLLRDGPISPGKLEQLVRDASKVEGEFLYTNGWLAAYAQDLAARLQG